MGAGIAVLLTAPFAIIALLGGIITSVMVICSASKSRGRAFLAFVLISAGLIPLSCFCIGAPFVRFAGEAVSAFFLFPVLGASAAAAMVLSALIASGRIRRSRPPPLETTPSPR